MQKQLAIKIGLLLLISLAILILVQLVDSKITERMWHRGEARDNIASSWTGPQQISSPVLVIPYREIPKVSKPGYYVDVISNNPRKLYYLYPQSSQVTATLSGKSLKRGIYSIPVYLSELGIHATFNAAQLAEKLAELSRDESIQLEGQPYIAMHIADTRGLDQNPIASINDNNHKVRPGSKMRLLDSGLHLPVSLEAYAGTDIEIDLDLSLRGMESLSILPLGNHNEVSIYSDWPHPEFFGRSLPRERSVSDKGFSAQWLTTPYSIGGSELIEQCESTYDCQNITQQGAGVRLILPVDIYTQSQRSLKYAMLFIGLSFISFFIFESLNPVRIHAIQYTFAGLAMTTFYLILFSLAEHIAFAYAYSIATLCCCALLVFYVRHMFASAKSAAVFTAGATVLYAILYVIIQAEDYALLMGSSLVFAILAALMMGTRKVNWYQLENLKERAR